MRELVLPPLVICGVATFIVNIYYFSKIKEDITADEKTEWIFALFVFDMLCLASIFMSIKMILIGLKFVLIPFYLAMLGWSIPILINQTQSQIVSNQDYDIVFVFFILDFAMHILFYAVYLKEINSIVGSKFNIL